jgi:hypothetical protein
MSATRGQRLRAARAQHFKSARTAAIALGLPISSYGAHERAEAIGGRNYGPDEAKRYARHFGVTAEWLLTGYDGAHPPSARVSNKVNVIGYVGARGAIHLYNVNPDQFEQIDVGLHAKAATVALDIRDGSLMRLLPKGWVVIYDDERRRPTSELVGLLCVVSDVNDQIFLKVLSRLEEGTPWAARVRALLPRS